MWRLRLNALTSKFSRTFEASGSFSHRWNKLNFNSISALEKSKFCFTSSRWTTFSNPTFLGLLKTMIHDKMNSLLTNLFKFFSQKTRQLIVMIDTFHLPCSTFAKPENTQKPLTHTNPSGICRVEWTVKGNQNKVKKRETCEHEIC